MSVQRPSFPDVDIAGISGKDLCKLVYHTKTEMPNRWKRAWENFGIAGHRCRYFFKGCIITDKKLVSRFIVHFRDKTSGLEELQLGDNIPAPLKGYRKKIDDLFNSIQERANGSKKYALLFADYWNAEQAYRNAKKFVNLKDDGEREQMNGADAVHSAPVRPNDSLAPQTKKVDKELDLAKTSLAFSSNGTERSVEESEPSSLEEKKENHTEDNEDEPSLAADHLNASSEEMEGDIKASEEGEKTNDKKRGLPSCESSSNSNLRLSNRKKSGQISSGDSGSSDDKFARKLGGIVDECLSRHQGIVVGEFHDDRMSKKFLIDHMEQFKRLGVKYLFVETINEEELEELKEFLDGEEEEMSESQKRALLEIDISNIARVEFGLSREEASLSTFIDYEKKQEYNLYRLVLEAKRQGIQIVSIDRENLRGVVLRPQKKRRLPEMNQFAEEKIKRLIKDDEKYVVFCGAAHTVHVKTSEPGLGSRLGVPVIHVHTPETKKLKSAVQEKHSYRNANFVYKPDYYVEYGRKAQAGLDASLA